LLALLLAGGLTAALAPRAPAAETEPPRRFLAERLASLNLTAEQTAAVKTILRNHQPTVEPLVNQVVTARRGLRDVIRATAIDETAIRAQAAKVAALETELAVQRAHLAHEIRGVLTPAQLNQLRESQVDADARVDDMRQRIAKRIAAE